MPHEPDTPAHPTTQLITVDVPAFLCHWRACGRWRGRALSAGFTLAELGYCLRRARSAEHLGARWAAKEAASRLTGEPWWRFELQRSQEGKPSLSGPGGPWLVSLTHDQVLASAWVAQVHPARSRLRASRRCRGGSSRRPQGCWSCRQRPCSSQRGRPGRSARRTGAPRRYGRPRPCYDREAHR